MRLLTILVILALISCHTGAPNEQQQNTDSLNKATQQEDKKRQDQLLLQKRMRTIMDERNNVLGKVTTDVPSFTPSAFGGFKNIRFNLFNEYGYNLEQVILKVHYIRANKKEVKTETIILKDVAPNSGRALTAPDYTAAGRHLAVTLETVLCRSINLCYYRATKTTLPDPYKCE